MRNILRNIIATILGILVFFAIVLSLGTVLTVVVTFLTKIRIIELLLYSPIGSLLLPYPLYVPAFLGANYVIKKIAGNHYLPFLIVGIALLIVYIPSGIITVLSNEASYSDLFGIGAGVFFIIEAMDLKKQ